MSISCAYDPQDNELRVRVGQELFEHVWAREFGVVQATLRASEVETLTLDLCETVWMDPHALLALAIAVEERRRLGKRRLLVLLADPTEMLSQAHRETSPKLHHKASQSAAFLNYLDNEGFLALLLGVDETTTSLPPETEIRQGDKVFQSYTDLARELRAFVPNTRLAAPAIPAQLIDCEVFLREDDAGPKGLTAFVDSLVTEAENRGLKRHFESRNHHAVPGKPTGLSKSMPESFVSPSFLAEELRQILLELIDNIKEHAYRLSGDDVPKLGAVYARLRYGLHDSRVAYRRAELLREYRQERNHSPLFKLGPTVEQVGFIEVFIADAGAGISRDLEIELKKEKPDRKHFLRVFFDRLAGDVPFSRHGSRDQREKEDKSPLPGLKHVVTLLERGKGFIRLLDREEWAGSEFPPQNPEDTGRKINIERSYSVGTTEPVQGTHVLVRASTGEPKELPKHWQTPVFAADELAELKESGSPPAHSLLWAWIEPSHHRSTWRHVRFHVIDQGFSERELGHSPEKDLEVEIGEHGETLDCVIWRPPKNLRRNDVRHELERIDRHPPRGHDESGGLHVVIVDQDSATALMTDWALGELTHWRAERIEAITILSNNLTHGTLVPSPLHGSAVKSRLKPLKSSESLFAPTPQEGLSLAHIVAALRELDGRVFWIDVFQNADRMHLLLEGLIQWRKGCREEPEIGFLDVFLDFPQALSLKSCRWACRRALGRFLAYGSPPDGPSTSDHLVEPLVNGFLYQANREFASLQTSSPPDGTRLELGSLLVETEEQALTPSLESSTLSAYFLRYPVPMAKSRKGSSKPQDAEIRNVPTLLPWLKPEDLGVEPPSADDAARALARVTDSPVVAPAGNRYWKMYRFLHGGSLYGSNPAHAEGVTTAEAYASWQNQGLLRLGHWHQGRHHDFVAVDLITALRLDRLKLRGGAWRFLLGHLRRLGPEYQEVHGFQPCDLLVCLTDEGTSLIVETASREYEWLEEKTTFLPLVQRQRNAMRLRVAPVVFEDLRSRIAALKRRKKEAGEQDPKVRLLLMDTQFRSSRSFFEVISLLRQAGADDVHTLALLDRSRLPNHERPFERNWHKNHARLWRLDIGDLAPAQGLHPSIGCPLCQAVNLAQRTAHGIPEGMRTAGRRLREWAEIGQVRVPSRASLVSGLPPIKLPKETPVRVAHYIGEPKSDSPSVEEHRDAEEHTIQVTEAGALTAALLEVVTMTGRHESVRTALEIIEKAWKDAGGGPASADSEGNPDLSEDKALQARIYVLAGQALLLRFDVERNRLKFIYTRLLDALFRSRGLSPATAFAGLILSSLEGRMPDDMVPVLLKQLETGGSLSLNLDYALTAAAIAKRSRTGKEHARLRAFLGLVSQVDEYAPMLLRDIFVTLGHRDGDVHQTKLSRLIKAEVTEESWGSLSTVNALAEALAERLHRLEAAEDWIAQTSEAKKRDIAKWAQELKNHCAALGNVLDELPESSWDDETDEQQAADRLDRARGLVRGLAQILYGPRSGQAPLYQRLRETFSVHVGEVEEMVERLLRNRPKEENDRIQQARRMDIRRDSRIRVVRLSPVEDCILELFDNAWKHRAGEYPDGVAVYWWAELRDDAVELEIRNVRGNEITWPVATLNEEILRRIGGAVGNEPDPSPIPGSEGLFEGPEFSVRIRLPTLGNLASL